PSFQHVHQRAQSFCFYTYDICFCLVHHLQRQPSQKPSLFLVNENGQRPQYDESLEYSTHQQFLALHHWFLTRSSLVGGIFHPKQFWHSSLLIQTMPAFHHVAGSVLAHQTP